MIDLDQDLNVFYYGGSGGFFFLHYVLLLKRHYCYFTMGKETDTQLKNYYKDKSELLFNSQILKYKCSKSYYETMAGSSWPKYEDYLSCNILNLPKNIQHEIILLHLDEISKLESSENWFDYKFNYIFKNQWVNQGRNWKENELWPQNEITFKNNYIKRHKIYFTVNKIEEWNSNPGLKILFYTDVDTQIRMCLYKNSGMFSYANKFPINNLSEVKKVVKKIKNQTVEINQSKVSYEVAEAWNQADIQIKLQDFVTKEVTIQTPTAQQIEFKNKWLSLHSNKLLKKIGII